MAIININNSHSCTLASALTSRHAKVEHLNDPKVGQGHEYDFCNSMENIEIFKSHCMYFFCTVSEMTDVQKVVSYQKYMPFSMTPFDGKYLILQKSFKHFCASSNCFIYQGFIF